MARKLKQGVAPSTQEWEKIQQIFDQNPGATGAVLQKSIREQAGVDVTLPTVYRWMKDCGVPTSRQSTRNRPVAHVDERQQVRRLLEFMKLPNLSEISAGTPLSAGGVSVVRLGRSGEELRLLSADGRTVTGVWMSAVEREYLEEILARADRNRGTDLVTTLSGLSARATELITEGLELQRSMKDSGEWRSLTGQAKTTRENAGIRLDQDLSNLAGLVEEFRGRVLLVTGA